MFKLRVTSDRHAAHEKRPAAPQHNRSRQNKFEPLPSPWRSKLHQRRKPGHNIRHGHDQNRNRERNSRPRIAGSCSTSSGFCSSSTLTVLGSRAMPQIGQDPGASRTISGCMGQVYSVFVTGSAATTGSSAIPHFGQSPGPCWRTSGSIGHVYSFEAGLRAAPAEAPQFSQPVVKRHWLQAGAICTGCADDSGAMPTRVFGIKIFCRVRAEFLFAACAAKVIRLPRVLVRGFRARRVHRHSADGIFFHRAGVMDFACP